MNKRISVLLPVYKKDKAEWVKISIDSILQQTYQDFLLLVGVDGPVEGELAATLCKYEGNDKVEIVRFEENRGLACVLNDLIEISEKHGCEYLARMDADDISLKDRFEKQVSFLEQNPEVDVVGGAIEEIDADGKSRGKTIVYPETHEDCKAFFATRDPHAHPAVMFRKSYFEKEPAKYRPDHRRNQDMMLWCDGMTQGTVHANLQEAVLRFRMAEDLFKKRRGGWEYANQQLRDRLEVNKTLHYGIKSYLVAYATFLMQLSPAWIKKIAYKVFR